MRTGRGAAFASVLVLLALAGTAEAAMPRVAGVQVALRAEGLYGGRIDGVKGPLTTRAVRTFQRRNDLAVDGIAGPRTRAELGRLGRPLPGKRVLRRGHVGLDVSALQFRLRQRGVAPGAVDGVFGPATAGAIRRFQGRAGLAVDGVAGPATHRALKHGKARSRAAARPRVRSASPASIRIALAHWSAYYGVSPSLVRALAWMESGHQNHVVSSTGAWGVMQVMPATWRFVETVLLGRRVPRTANGNVRVGVAYLHHLLRTFRGNTRLALGAYHQGPAAVRRHGLYPETRRFVRAVRALERRM